MDCRHRCTDDRTAPSRTGSLSLPQQHQPVDINTTVHAIAQLCKSTTGREEFTPLPQRDALVRIWSPAVQRKTNISHDLNTAMRGHANGECRSDTPGLAEFQTCLVDGGRRAAVALLNHRTPHRFTGIFQFAGEMLVSIELVDKWDWTVSRCDDVPIASAYCAHLQRTGEPLVVVNGQADTRVPWMNNSPVASYCGAVIQSPTGQAWGALCHFDLRPCESNRNEIALLAAAARLLWPSLPKDAH